jgi:hypothetical protein
MQSDILGCLGIGKDGETVIGTKEGNNIITNISEGFDQKMFDDLDEGLKNKQRCRVAYTGKKLIKLWVDEKIIFESGREEER